MWIRLSNLTPLRRMVLPSVARSIAQLAPISTSSSITTLPICGIFLPPPGPTAKRKPSLPITVPLWMMQFLAHHAVRIDLHTGENRCVVTDGNIVADVRLRIDLHVVADARVLTDEGQWAPM
jgi:hypothetical protein